MLSNSKILVVLPAYNEEGKIGSVVTGIKNSIEINFPLSILVVSDGSTDKTVLEAEEAGAIVLSKECNEGVGSALREGFHYAQKNGYDIIVVMAGDAQDEPGEIPDIIEPLVSRGYDFVQGSRRLTKVQVINITLFRRITTKIYSLIFSFILNRRITDGTNGFRAFKIEILSDKRINLDQEWLNTYELEPYLYYQVMTLGYRVTEVQVTKRYHKRVIGYSKMVPFIDWWRILKPIIYLKFKIKK